MPRSGAAILMDMALLSVPAVPTTQAPSVPSIANLPITSAHMLDALHGWALTDTDVLKTTNGESRWTDVTPKGTRVLGNSGSGAAFLNARRAWVACSLPHSTAVDVYATMNGGGDLADVPYQAVGTGYVNDSTMPLNITFLNRDGRWLMVSDGIASGSEPVEIVGTPNGGIT